MDKQTKRFYEFGPFRLDTANRLLMHEGEVVQLKRKAVETLLVLVESRGEVLEKDELMQRLWPDSFVEESNLTQNIYTLRKALGEGVYIETVPRRGYRFAAEVREWEEDSSDLIVRESTRESILIEEAVETDESPAGEALKRTATALGTLEQTGRRLRLALAVGAIVSVALLSVFYFRWRREDAAGASQSSPVRSIAVLPFKTLDAGGEADAYMGLGMADALITKLSGAGRLIVRPTSAVLRYANAQGDSAEVGRELGVDCVLEGSIQRQDGRTRLTVRLVRASDGRSLWAGKFDEPDADVFRLQDAVSEKVTGELALRLSSEEQRHLNKRYTENAEAEELYLKGRYFWAKRTEDGLRKSIDCFEQAVALDPNYALAYTGLADAYIQLPGYSQTASMEVYPKAKAASARALQLDDSLAEAHNSAAGVLSYFEWNWREAEEEYRKAIALNPNYPAAHQRLGVQLAASGRSEEALTELKTAQKLDPLSLIINSLQGFAHVQARQYDEGVARLRATLEMDANFPPAHEFLARAFREQGMQEESFKEYLEWRRLSGDGEEKLEAYKKAFAASGLQGFYKQRLKYLLAQKEHASPTELAQLCALSGEKEQALSWLEKSVEQHEGEVIWVKTLSDFDSVRQDPRFAALLRRINMAE